MTDDAASFFFFFFCDGICLSGAGLRYGVGGSGARVEAEDEDDEEALIDTSLLLADVK